MWKLFGAQFVPSLAGEFVLLAIVLFLANTIERCAERIR